jgi:hypothetical protein
MGGVETLRFALTQKCEVATVMRQGKLGYPSNFNPFLYSCQVLRSSWPPQLHLTHYPKLIQLLVSSARSRPVAASLAKTGITSDQYTPIGPRALINKLNPNIRAEGFRDSKKTLVLKKVALIRRFWRFTWRV